MSGKYNLDTDEEIQAHGERCGRLFDAVAQMSAGNPRLLLGDKVMLVTVMPDGDIAVGCLNITPDEVRPIFEAAIQGKAIRVS